MHMNTISSLKTLYQSGKIEKQDFILQALKIHNGLFDYIDITKSTDINEIRVTSEGIRFEMGDDKICMFAPPNEARVAPIEVMYFGQYEPYETKVMDLISDNALNVLDIGANIGWFSVRFAKRLRNARIYAFEPMPETFHFLQRNISENKVGEVVSSYNYGLSEKSGCSTFYIAPQNGTNASLQNVSGVTNARKVLGLTMTLDEWRENMQVKVDFIKCDVEGAEYLVFKGGRHALQNDKPVIFTELLRKWTKPFGYHPNDLVFFLKELGYDCYAISNDSVIRLENINEETIETNYVFLNRSVHASIISKLDTIS